MYVDADTHVSSRSGEMGADELLRQMDDVGVERAVAWLCLCASAIQSSIVLGYFAQALGLVVELAEVPIEQRKGRDHTPQKKLIEFLVGILGGIEHLQDLNLAEQPIARDPTVAEAWAQAIFAHYSGVSRTLEASDEDTLGAVIEVLRSISRPFIDAAVVETVKQDGRLTVDVDLTGRKVSSSSYDFLAMNTKTSCSGVATASV
jgi:hypothetical protein